MTNPWAVAWVVSWVAGLLGSVLMGRRALRRQAAALGQAHAEELTAERTAAFDRLMVDRLELACRADDRAGVELPGTAALMLRHPEVDLVREVERWGPCQWRWQQDGPCGRCVRCRALARWVRAGMVPAESVPDGVDEPA